AKQWTQSGVHDDRRGGKKDCCGLEQAGLMCVCPGRTAALQARRSGRGFLLLAQAGKQAERTSPEKPLTVLAEQRTPYPSLLDPRYRLHQSPPFQLFFAFHLG